MLTSLKKLQNNKIAISIKQIVSSGRYKIMLLIVVILQFFIQLNTLKINTYQVVGRIDEFDREPQITMIFAYQFDNFEQQIEPGSSPVTAKQSEIEKQIILTIHSQILIIQNQKSILITRFPSKPIITIITFYPMIMEQPICPTQSKQITTHPKKPSSICKLCSTIPKDHSSANCPSAKVYYHATNRNCLEPITQQGFIPRIGRLGKAVYVSQDPVMCVKFVYKNSQKFNDPILLKLKVAINGNLKRINHHSEIRTLTSEQLQRENVKGIQCPYFSRKGKSLCEIALFKCDYAVVAWSAIQFAIPKQVSVADDETYQKKKNKQMVDEKHQQKIPEIQEVKKISSNHQDDKQPLICLSNSNNSQNLNQVLGEYKDGQNGLTKKTKTKKNSSTKSIKKERKITKSKKSTQKQKHNQKNSNLNISAELSFKSSSLVESPA